MPEHDHNSTHGNQVVEDPGTAVRSSGYMSGHGNGIDYRRPARRGLASAIPRHPFLALLPAIFLLAAGIAAGGRKQLTYSASATINVGKSDIITQATPGYVQAAQVLATSYSRVVMSQHVFNPVVKATGESISFVGTHLVASPIPGEPTFTITGTGTSAQAAIKLTNAAVKAIVNFANVAQTQSGSPSQLLAQYVSAQTRADNLRSKSASLAAKRTSGVSDVTQSQVTKAQVQSQVATLQAQAAGNAYSTLMQNGVSPVLDVFDTATYATNNRTSNIEKYAIVGLAAGIVLGVALAALVGGLEAWRDDRRGARPA
jgi:capsular polysaccharide biosynthesis protein